ncbi:hypothetical protein ACWEQ4_01095 [Rhodococcus sp. NPDC003994]
MNPLRRLRRRRNTPPPCPPAGPIAARIRLWDTNFECVADSAAPDGRAAFGMAAASGTTRLYLTTDIVLPDRNVRFGGISEVKTTWK